MAYLRSASRRSTLNNLRVLRLAFLLLLFGLVLWPTGVLGQAAGIYRELFNGLDRANSSLWQLTNDLRFINNAPSSTSILTSFRTEQNRDDDYGQRLRAFLVPPSTGGYTFWIASDETSQLFLSSDEDPAHKQLIAWVDPRVQPDTYTTFTWQQSSNIILQAGRRYYIEALHHEANLIDHLSVQWRLPNNVTESPIPSTRLIYEMAPYLTVTPVDLTIEEGRPAIWSVTTANFVSQSYRWTRNGVDVPDATNRSYSLPVTTLADHGARFSVSVTNRFGSTNAPEVVLTVLRDTNQPVVIDLVNGSATNVLVTFSEPVEAASALDRQHYNLLGAIIQNANFGDDTHTVILTTSPLVMDTAYALSINSVRDRASQPNTMITTQAAFVARTFTPRSVGKPALAGSITAVPGGVDVSAAGADLGGFVDQGEFGLQLVTGDFDYQVRVEALDFTDIWAKAGLVARENLDAGSRFAGTLATPAMAGSFFEYRTDPNRPAASTGTFPPSYPNMWLRLARVGDRFSGYASGDGQAWTLLGSASLALSNRLYFGVGASSHRTNRLAVTRLRDFAPITSGNGRIASSPPVEALGPSSRRTGLVLSEIMYHPRDVDLGTHQAELEFVELFNSNPFSEDLSDYRLSGDIAYTFPSGTILAGGALLVVARAPADLEAVYHLTGVLGPFTNNLPNGGGQIHLRNNSDTILLEVEYSNKPPWPVAADGAGHSLVLAHPSYGEGQQAAWAASDAIGGSPGRLEPLGSEPLRPVVINEFLAHTDAPQLDFIELFNAGEQPLDLGGAFLSDSAGTNKFRFPSPTLISARGFVSLDQDQLGFSLKAAGERIFLINSNQTRVIDAIGFNGQARGISSGRFPDGASAIQELSAPTPGTANAAVLTRDIVINELMYGPISGDSADEYVELFNKGTDAISLAGWRFSDGIGFTFPSNTVIASGGYLVVAKDPVRLRANYPQLNKTNTVGGFSGSLRNRGERLALAMPQLAVSSDDPGNLATNLIYVDVDEVEYQRGGAWGHWANGGGSSLELIDPHSDNRLGPNWADSDETAKAPWTTIEFTGPLDNGGDSPTALHVMLLEEGECLFDDVQVSVGTGANLVPNATFESGTNSWLMRGNHERSSLETAEGFNSSRSLHIRASSRGDIGANKILINLSSAPAGVATIRAKARWLKGWPELLLRLRGSWLEATDRMILPRNLGTPGARNSRTLNNAGPALTAVNHTPAVPAAAQSVVITARAADPDGVASVLVHYRIDPSTSLSSLAMNDAGVDGDAVAGDGLFSATLPGQAADKLVAFTLEATDTLGAVTRFPPLRTDNSPVREGLIHFGGAVPANSFGTYRFWITQQSITNWAAREVLSNEPIPGTFIYGNQRVIYDAGARYSGSPAHQDQAAPDFSPTGTPNHYTIDVPGDDLVLGTDNLNKIHGSGNNHHDDNTLVREVTAYWIGRQLGLPENYKRYMIMFINGARRGSLMEDTQVPNGDVIDGLFADDPEGDLYKLSIWYEFGPPARVLSANGLAGCTLNNYTTTGGVKKRARYRWNWQGRAVHGTANDYTSVYALIDAANTPATGPFAQNFDGLVDTEQWMQTFALEHAVGNWDSFGYRNEQNMFAYKPERGRWQLLIWDINIIFGGGTRGLPVAVTGDLFENSAANVPIVAFYNHPQFRRAYWRALRDLAEGPMLNAKVDPFMDSRFAAFTDSGVNVTAPDAIKTWISQRRAYIQSQLAAADFASFRITTADGLSSSSNLVTLSGTAPTAAKTIEVNGVARAVTWTSLSNWTVRVVLEQAQNTLAVVAYDQHGRLIPGGTGQVTMQYTGPIVAPEDHIVINEIQYDPGTSEASFVEVFNTATNVSFDLSNWRLNGLDYVFPEGSLITNRQHLLLVKNRTVFSQVYGVSNFISGEFQGQLDHSGETLSLERPSWRITTNGATLQSNLVYVVVDRVKYDDALPWPPAADGTGPSLQLIDASRDNSRVSNWAAGNGWINVTRTGNIGMATNLLLWLGALGNAFVDDFTLIGPGDTNVVLDGDFEADLGSFWLLSTNHSGSYRTNGVSHSGASSLFIDATAPGGQPVASIQQAIGDRVITNATYTLSYWIRFHTNPAPVNVRTFPGSSLVTAGTTQPLASSPGAPNQFIRALPAYDPLWLNELQPDNRSGRKDNAGQFEPWIELYNAGNVPLNLEGYFLADNYTSNLTQWAFPAGVFIAPGEFKIVWADDEPNQTVGTNLHTNFRLAPNTGTVALVRWVDSRPQITDYLTYRGVGPNLAYGSVPDGQPFTRQTLYLPTPGAANYAAPVPLFINEWLAANTNNAVDPADGDHEDWFELYNAGDSAVDLGGYFLSDAPANPAKFRIPAGYLVPAHGFLVVWADEETGQNQAGVPDLHVNFRLAAGGESIILSAPTGEQIDRVDFGPQLDDVSQGRFVDGAASIVTLAAPTPGAPNRFGTGNSAPQISPIPDQTVTLGQTLRVTVVATDAESPPQTLQFNLEGAVPNGASIQSVSGLFTWTPTPAQTPSANPILVRVTDNGAPALSATRSFTAFVVGPPRLTGLTRASDGTVSFGVSVVPGKRYRVEYTDSLASLNWIRLGGDRIPGGTLLMIEDAPTPPTGRFYRVSILD
ncbi:MAG TPA: lamin tail domain-containing protein [Verrucomicrobiae bacterium]|nr:lamin tail domain-containing protein [Verrucomicrobiae bacterium]